MLPALLSRLSPVMGDGGWKPAGPDRRVNLGAFKTTRWFCEIWGTDIVGKAAWAVFPTLVAY